MERLLGSRRLAKHAANVFGNELGRAASQGDAAEVVRLLRLGHDANELTLRGSPLHEACRRGHLAVAQVGTPSSHVAVARLARTLQFQFLNNRIRQVLCDVGGCSVNACDITGDTPLHCCVSHGHVELARLLVARGANVHAKEVAGATPLQCATTSIFIPTAEARRQASTDRFPRSARRAMTSLTLSTVALTNCGCL